MKKNKKNNTCNKINNIYIVSIDYAIAFRIGKIIYLNKNLNKYPKLKKAIIKHELEHTDGFNLKDIIVDLTGTHLSEVKKQYYKFLFKEKKAWYQFLPLLRIEKKWSLDVIMLTLWVLFLVTLGIVIKVTI